MGEVIPFDRGKFLRYYVPQSIFQTILEETLFVLGVLGSFVAPEGVYCAFGGLVPWWIFVMVTQAGVIVGLVKYICPTAFVALDLGQTIPISQNESTRRRKLS